MRTNKSIITNM